MGRMKEVYMEQLEFQFDSKNVTRGGDMDKYNEDSAVEQEIAVGDTVRVYDTRSGFKPYEATVVYRKLVGDSIILDVDPCTNDLRGPVQVFDIQCRKLSKRLPRILWLKFNTETQKYDVSVKRPADEQGWAMFKEEI